MASMGGISLKFQLDYTLFNQKMSEFYDQHADEIRAIMGQCFKVEEPDMGQRLKEIKGPIVEDIPAEPFDNMFKGVSK